MFLSTGSALRQFTLQNGAWHRANTSLMVISDFILSFAILGIRVVFSIPLELRANWIFRVASHAGAHQCVATCRCSLYVLALLPVWVAAAALFFWLWPWQIAAKHLVLLGMLGIGIIELAVYDFHKIPFTCSIFAWQVAFQYGSCLPGLILMSVTWTAELEMRALSEPKYYAVVFLCLIAAAALARWRNTANARSEYAVTRFDEVPEAAISALSLRS